MDKSWLVQNPTGLKPDWLAEIKLWSKKKQSILPYKTETVAQRCSAKKQFLEISQNSQESTCVRISFLINLQAWGLKPTTLLGKRVWHRCFPVNFAEFLRTSFLTEHLWWLLLIRVLQNFYFKSEVKTLGESFLKFVCHLFSKLTLH